MTDYSKLAEHLREPDIHSPGNFDTPKRANALLLCLCQEAADAIADLLEQLAEAQRDAQVGKQFGDLWYFAMDEAAADFERIVTTCPPATWMHEITKIKQAKRASDGD